MNPLKYTQLYYMWHLVIRLKSTKGWLIYITSDWGRWKLILLTNIYKLEFHKTKDIPCRLIIYSIFLADKQAQILCLSSKSQIIKEYLCFVPPGHLTPITFSLIDMKYWGQRTITNNVCVTFKRCLTVILYQIIEPVQYHIAWDTTGGIRAYI